MTALTESPQLLARLLWTDPTTDEAREFVLSEGATVSIGRQESSDIFISEQHVSRQHAVISYQDGVFVLRDLGSANGVFLNDARVTEPMPLLAGDTIRLYVPTLFFAAVAVNLDARQISAHGGTVITPIASSGRGELIITTGPQEGTSIPLLKASMTIGRASSRADWEIRLQDASVSRPHARLTLQDSTWLLTDLGSANGTFVNGTQVTEKGRALRDGDVIAFGTSVCLYRAG
jgi:pSer/pThr/pTyr-binding forkhead associated (FHA) protein